MGSNQPKTAPRRATSVQRKLPVRYLPERGTWMVRVRDLDGKQVSTTWPTEEEAIDQAEDVLARLRLARLARRRGEQVGVRVLGGAPKVVPTDTATLAKDYLANLRARARRESHLVSVKQVLDSLAQAVPNLAAADAPAALETWLNTRQRVRGERPLSPRTRNRWLITARALCRWGMRRKRLQGDPTEVIELAAVPHKLKPQFSIDELRQLLACTYLPPVDGKPPERDRWHVLVALMVYAGLRSSEAAHLRWQDIDWSGRAVLVRLASGARVKRDKERIVPMQPELLAILEPLRQAEGRIWPHYARNLRRGFHAFLKRADVRLDGRTPHSCRHGYCGLMTASGTPSLLLQAYMGHDDTETTEGYAGMAVRYVHGVEGWRRGEFQLRYT